MRERRKVMTGRVVSDKMAKTVIVAVEERRSHPLYGKVVTSVRRFKANNDEPLAKRGDLVKITEARPMSREKRWQVTEIVHRGVVVEQIVEKELESLREKEATDRATRQAEDERRAAARLAKLAGEEETPPAETPEEATSEMPAATAATPEETSEGKPEGGE